MANEPSTLPECASIAADQQARNPWGSATPRYGSQRGSWRMSVTTTGSLRYMAVPHDPALGPMQRPSMALVYASGRLGAAPCRACCPSSSRSMDRAKQAGKLGFHNPYQLLQYFLQVLIRKMFAACEDFWGH